MTAPREMPAMWRQRAKDLRRYGAISNAAALEAAADELESALCEEADELFNLEQAAVISGFSADHLGREVGAGRIPNWAVRVRRASAVAISL